MLSENQWLFRTMKKILLLSLGLILFQSELSANVKVNTIQQISFSTLISKDVKISDLSFKNVMRTFYGGRLINGKVNEIDFDGSVDSNNTKPIENSILITPPPILEKLPKEKYDPETKQTYSVMQLFSHVDYYGAVMSDVVKYKNKSNEDRYMLMVTTEGLQEDNTFIAYRTALSIVDIYVFKKNTDDTFSLVTRTPENLEPNRGDALVFLSQADPDIDRKAIEFKAIGNNTIGAISNRLYSHNHGYYSDDWVILHLPENDFITLNWIPKGEMSGMDESFPTYYEYDSTISIQNDRSEYFPLLVHYKGEKPIYRKDGTVSNVKNIDVVTKFVFASSKKDYIEMK